MENEELWEKIENIRLLTHHTNRNKIKIDNKNKKLGAKKGHKGYFFVVPDKVDKIINIKIKKCPECKKKVGKVNFIKPYFCRDLIISRKSITVKDIRYLVHNYYCKKCGRYVYTKPKRMINQSVYGIGMFVYSTVKRITLFTPYNKISSEIEQLFSTNISNVAPLKFLNRMAIENQEGYDDVLKKIKKAKVLHSDETRWPINGVKWWVWVFTSDREAVYILNEKRDAKVPTDLLKEFKGVLVCDFYSAYEKVKCKQQKCLVHVLRDFQKALKAAPYDDELRIFIQEFLDIFNPIFEKLREKPLSYELIRSQKLETRKKIKDLIKKQYLSKTVNTFKKRFKKHLENMIRFMNNPEKISWNNNKAERDLRPLCVQRKISGTMKTEKDSNAYLLLFSIYQTCEKRGINFMKFLLSRRKKIPKKAIKSLAK